MLMSRKAEASIEFMVFIGILLLFFVFFIGIISYSNGDINEATAFDGANNILNTLVNEINTAARIEGYHREFFLQESLPNGGVYNITFYTSLRMVGLNWTGQRNVFSSIITENVTGTVYPGHNTIRNDQGVVKINES